METLFDLNRNSKRIFDERFMICVTKLITTNFERIIADVFFMGGHANTFHSELILKQSFKHCIGHLILLSQFRDSSIHILMLTIHLNSI